MTETNGKEKTKESKPKNNTMDIRLVNSNGQVIHMSGSCLDQEIKAIGRAINHSHDQKVEIT